MGTVKPDGSMKFGFHSRGASSLASPLHSGSQQPCVRYRPRRTFGSWLATTCDTVSGSPPSAPPSAAAAAAGLAPWNGTASGGGGNGSGSVELGGGGGGGGGIASSIFCALA
eukprot:COSAG01_NODE_7665_length_3107_cov_2.577793_6_plen_111_part_01